MKKSLESLRSFQAASRVLCVGLLGLVAFAMVQTDAAAQQFGRSTEGTTVRERQRPDFDPIGLRAGSFWIYPSLTGGIEYDDNIFATAGNKIDDAIFTVRPLINIRSDWSRHALSLQASGNLGFHADYSSEDYEDAQLRLRGQVDITRDSRINISLRADRRHEARDSPDDAGGISPTIFYVFSPDISLWLQFNRVTVRLASRLSLYDFKDTLAAGGIVINEDDRDRLVWEGSAEVGYSFSPSIRGFVRGSYDIRHYDQQIDDKGLMRDSNGFGVFGGLALELTGTLSAEGYIGYRRQRFDDPSFVTIDGITGGLDFIWTATELTTVTIGGERTIQETTQLGVSGVLETEFTLTVDHELLRQMIVSVEGAILDRRFRGNGRHDTGWRTGMRVTYLVNRYLNLDLSYDYRKRDSNFNFEDFSRNRAHFSFRLQL